MRLLDFVYKYDYESFEKEFKKNIPDGLVDSARVNFHRLRDLLSGDYTALDNFVNDTNLLDLDYLRHQYNYSWNLQLEPSVEYEEVDEPEVYANKIKINAFIINCIFEFVYACKKYISTLDIELKNISLDTTNTINKVYIIEFLLDSEILVNFVIRFDDPTLAIVDFYAYIDYEDIAEDITEDIMYTPYLLEAAAWAIGHFSALFKQILTDAKFFNVYENISDNMIVRTLERDRTKYEKWEMRRCKRVK